MIARAGPGPGTAHAVGSRRGTFASPVMPAGSAGCGAWLRPIRPLGAPSGHAGGGGGYTHRGGGASAGGAGGSHAISASASGTVRCTIPCISRSDALDDRRDAHAATDAQRDQRGGLVRTLELVERRPEQDRAGRTQRVAEGDRATIDVDLVVIDAERA